MKPLFFDIDGTLHKQDMFADFLRFLLRKRWWNGVFLLPLLLLGVLIWRCVPKGKFGLNLIYFVACFGLNEQTYRSQVSEFERWFKRRYTPFEQVQAKLSPNTRIWLISGSPVELIEAVYPELVKQPNVSVIGTQTQPLFGSLWISERCYGEQKVVMLESRFPHTQFVEGYSDSLSDLPILRRCERAFLVGKKGEISELDLQKFVGK